MPKVLGPDDLADPKAAGWPKAEDVGLGAADAAGVVSLLPPKRLAVGAVVASSVGTLASAGFAGLLGGVLAELASFGGHASALVSVVAAASDESASGVCCSSKVEPSTLPKPEKPSFFAAIGDSDVER